MSRQNKVNPGMYTQRGRLTQDDAARELRRQRDIGSQHTWQPVQRDAMPWFKSIKSTKADAPARADETATPAVKRKAAKAKAPARKAAKATMKTTTRRAAKKAARTTGRARKAAETKAKAATRATAVKARATTGRKAVLARGAAGLAAKARKNAKR